MESQKKKTKAKHERLLLAEPKSFARRINLTQAVII